RCRKAIRMGRHSSTGATPMPRDAVTTVTNLYDALSVHRCRMLNEALSEKSKRCVVGPQSSLVFLQRGIGSAGISHRDSWVGVAAEWCPYPGRGHGGRGRDRPTTQDPRRWSTILTKPVLGWSGNVFGGFLSASGKQIFNVSPSST